MKLKLKFQNKSKKSLDFMAFSQFLYLLFLETFCSGNNFYMTKINCVQTKSFRLAGLIWETLLISIVYY